MWWQWEKKERKKNPCMNLTILKPSLRYVIKFMENKYCGTDQYQALGNLLIDVLLPERSRTF
jgi:hypothetical protein